MYKIIPRPKKIEIKDQKKKFTFYHINTYKCIDLDQEMVLAVQKLLLELGQKLSLQFVGHNLMTKHEQDFYQRFEFIYDESLKFEEYKINLERPITKIYSSSKDGFSSAMASITQIYLQNEFFIESEIRDNPDRSWRGTLFDISRHFFTIEELKKCLFVQWLYKQNIMHLHLTDDQGWRLEIKSMPELLEKGSYRLNKDDDRSIYNGHVRQSEIKELIEYANILNIEIIPEIDFPGHVQPLLYTYPELLCSFDKVDKTWNKWGVSEQVLCLSSPKTLEVMKNILKEVAELFPSKYIHIGGDEAPIKNWEKCDNCQKYIEDNNYKNEYDMQRNFVKNIVNYLTSLNKKVICWDDLIEKEEIDTISVAAFWRTWAYKDKEGNNLIDKLIKKSNTKILINPSSHVYFDHAQNPQELFANGIPSGWVNDLEKTYSLNYKEFLKNYDSEQILGSECNLWSEQIETFDELTKRWLPRMLAFQEVLWGTKTDINDFKKRLNQNGKVLDRLNIKWTKV